MRDVSRVASAALPPILAIAVVLLAWEVAVKVSGVEAYLLPGPVAIAHALLDDSGAMLRATAWTAMAACIGFGIAVAIGVVGGSIIASVAPLRRALYPLATTLQMVPLVAVAPLLVIWLGFGMPTAIASAAVVALFPILASTIDGQVSVDPGLREVFALYRANRWQRWSKLDLPASVPGIVTGLRIASGLAVIGTIVGEFVSGYGGPDAPLGIVIMTAMREARTDRVFAAVALSAVVGLTLFALVSALGWAATRRWHASGINTLEESTND